MLSATDIPASFEGQVVRPGDGQYDQAREIFNHLNRGRPALIARCANDADAQLIVNHAAEHGIPLAVRGGGHGVEGSAMPDDALVLDMSALRGIEIDPVKRVARVQAGVLLGELDAAAQAHGLAVPSGTVTSTGIAGLTFGGGVGLLMRHYGATVDSLLACELATVGRPASAGQHAREPGAVLGAAWRRWQLRRRHELCSFAWHPVGPQVVRGQLAYPRERAPEILAAVGEYMASAPRELTLIAALTQAPGGPRCPSPRAARRC